VFKLHRRYYRLLRAVFVFSVQSEQVLDFSPGKKFQERQMANPIVSIIMGSRSDLETMQRGADVLKELGVPYEIRIISAHRTPDDMFRFAEQAAGRGIEVIIAGAGGAAHLPGMVAAKTVLPVIGVPVNATPLNGMDALLSIVQMPRGVPVATVAIGIPGATNAGLLAAQIVGIKRPEIQQRLTERREKAAAEVRASSEVEG
jgi:5-(carboxyamino)imidazole ribonucleotide mutase